MNWLMKYRIILSFFILLGGSGLNAQTSQSFSSYDSIWVKDTMATEQLLAADTFFVSQPDQFKDQKGLRITASSKEEMKARRKAKTDRFWTKVLLGFIALLLKNGCCNCEDY